MVPAAEAAYRRARSHPRARSPCPSRHRKPGARQGGPKRCCAEEAAPREPWRPRSQAHRDGRRSAGQDPGRGRSQARACDAEAGEGASRAATRSAQAAPRAGVRRGRPAPAKREADLGRRRRAARRRRRDEGRRAYLERSERRRSRANLTRAPSTTCSQAWRRVHRDRPREERLPHVDEVIAPELEGRSRGRKIRTCSAVARGMVGGPDGDRRARGCHRDLGSPADSSSSSRTARASASRGGWRTTSAYACATSSRASR